MIRILGQYGTDPAVRTAAADLATQYLNAPDSVSSDLGREALRITALSGDGELYAVYKQAYLDAQSEDLKSNILGAIYFDDAEIVRSHLDFSISDAVAAGDVTTGIGFYAAILEDQAILYDWLDQHLDAFKNKIPSFIHPMLPQLFQSTCDAQNLELLNDFFDDRGDLYAPALAKANETIENCIARRARESEALDQFLAQFAD